MNVYQQILTNLLTGTATAVVVLTYIRLKTKDTKDTTKESITLSVKMDMVLNSLNSISTKLDKHEGRIEAIEKKIAVLETKIKE